MDTSAGLRLMRISEVCDKTTLGQSTINLWVAQGKFPTPITLSKTIKVWCLSEVDQWITNMRGVDENINSSGEINGQPIAHEAEARDGS